MKKIESPNMTSKVVYELLIRSYERFMYFSQITVAKNTIVNQRKSKNHEELNFNCGKIQKMEHRKMNSKLL